METIASQLRALLGFTRAKDVSPDHERPGLLLGSSSCLDPIPSPRLVDSQDALDAGDRREPIEYQSTRRVTNITTAKVTKRPIDPTTSAKSSFWRSTYR